MESAKKECKNGLIGKTVSFVLRRLSKSQLKKKETSYVITLQTELTTSHVKVESFSITQFGELLSNTTDDYFYITFHIYLSM